MTKQEEIREGIYKLVCEGIDNEIPPKMTETKISNFLHSQGVVIKVEMELPEHMDVELTLRDDDGDLAFYYTDQKALDKAGYVAVEPLIEEE